MIPRAGQGRFGSRSGIPHTPCASHISKPLFVTADVDCVVQCVGSWLNSMVDPSVVAESIESLDEYLTGTLTPLITTLTTDLTAYEVVLTLLMAHWCGCSCR